MRHQVHTRQCEKRDCHLPIVANSTMVPTLTGTGRQSHLPVTRGPPHLSPLARRRQQKTSSEFLQFEPSRSDDILGPSDTKRFPPYISCFLAGSLRSSTATRYVLYCSKWIVFCQKQQRNSHAPTVRDIIDFMYHLGKSNNFHSYSASFFQTVLSMLKQVIDASHHHVLQHVYVKHFQQGYFNMYLPQPKPPCTTWDIQQVLDYWQCQPSNQKLNLTQLARKTMMLILLSTCRWKNKLLSLSVKHMYTFPQCIMFYLVKLPKTFTQGTPDENTRWLSVRQADQSVDNNLCPVRALTVYLAKTRRIQSSDSVFVTSTPPYSAIKPMTLNLWILQSMKQAGIDTSLYTAYSTRHASSSGALKKGMPMDEVLRLGCWKTPSTFIKHYNLPILKTPIAATSTSDPSLDTNTVILPKIYIPRTGDHTARRRRTAKQTHTQIAKIRAKTVKNTQVQRTVTKIKEKAVKTLQSKPTLREIILSILSPQQDVQATELNTESSTIEQEVTIHTSDNNTLQAQVQESEPVQGCESVQLTLDPDPPPAQDIEQHEPDLNLTMDESDMEIDVTETDNLEKSEKMSDEQLTLLAFGTQSQMLQATEHPVNPQHGRVTVYTDEQFIRSDHAYTTSPQVHAERKKLVRLSKAVEEKEFEECFQLREYEGMLMRLGIACEWRSTNRTHLNIPIISEDGLLLGFHKQIQIPVMHHDQLLQHLFV